MTELRHRLECPVCPGLVMSRIRIGKEMAVEVDTAGRVVVLTTHLEEAELKRDQIQAFGPDPLIPRCKGSMSATVEPAQA